MPELRTLLSLPADAEIIGTVASLAPHKNHALLLESVPAVIALRPRAHFVWLGEGECRGALEQRRARLGLELRVHLAGFHPEARALMRQFDLFVLSSHLEGLCTSLLDAQVLGVPIVATAVGGVPEVVQDGVSGRLVRTLDAGALAVAIVGALADPGARAAWVAGARTSVEAFSIGLTAERTLAFEMPQAMALENLNHWAGRPLPLSASVKVSSAVKMGIDAPPGITPFSLRPFGMPPACS